MDNVHGSTQSVRYRIDGTDTICSVNEAFFSFGQSNGRAIKADQVLNHSLFDFIDGEPTRYLTKTLFARVRESGRPVQIAFRCDSPECRRFMNMHIETAAKGELLFENQLVKIEPRQPISMFARYSQHVSDQLLTMCSWCNRVLSPDQRWFEVDVAISDSEWFLNPATVTISHGICPDCRVLLLSKS